MKQLVAYNNDPLMKAGIVANIKKKIADGQMEHGTYGTFYGSEGITRGCAVFLATGQTRGAHSYAEREYGIPEELYRYLDRIFEGLVNSPPADEEWPIKFHEAITPGADLSMVAPKFRLWIVQDMLRHEHVWRKHDTKNEYAQKVVDVLNQTAAFLKQWIETGVYDIDTADAARIAARAAVDAAEYAAVYAAASIAVYASADTAANPAYTAASIAVYAARAAAYATRAASIAVYAAVDAARAATDAAAYEAARAAVYAAADAAAYEAARAAVYAAADAAENDFYIRCSEKLLALLREAPIAREIEA